MQPNKKTALAGAALLTTSENHYNNSANSFQEVNQLALNFLPALLSRWLPGGSLRGCEYVARNPRRTDNKPGSFSVNTNTGRWADFATGDKGGDVISLAAYLFDVSQGEARSRIEKMLGV